MASSTSSGRPEGAPAFLTCQNWLGDDAGEEEGVGGGWWGDPTTTFIRNVSIPPGGAELEN